MAALTPNRQIVYKYGTDDLFTPRLGRQVENPEQVACAMPGAASQRTVLFRRRRFSVKIDWPANSSSDVIRE